MLDLVIANGTCVLPGGTIAADIEMCIRDRPVSIANCSRSAGSRQAITGCGAG